MGENEVRVEQEKKINKDFTSDFSFPTPFLNKKEKKLAYFFFYIEILNFRCGPAVGTRVGTRLCNFHWPYHGLTILLCKEW